MTRYVQPWLSVIIVQPSLSQPSSPVIRKPGGDLHSSTSWPEHVGVEVLVGSAGVFVGCFVAVAVGVGVDVVVLVTVGVGVAVEVSVAVGVAVLVGVLVLVGVVEGVAVQVWVGDEVSEGWGTVAGTSVKPQPDRVMPREAAPPSLRKLRRDSDLWS